MSETLEAVGSRHIAARDQTMAALIQAVGTVELPRRRGRYEALVRAIIAQQLSTKAARTIFLRARGLCGGRLTPSAVAALGDAELRAAGFSRAKLASVRDLTERCQSRSLRLDRLPQLEDEAIIAELIQVRGIGRWSAEMFLIFVLTRPDVLPHTDLGIQKGFQKVYRMRSLPSAERMHRIADKWRPYRTVGSWYLWRSHEIELNRAAR